MLRHARSAPRAWAPPARGVPACDVPLEAIPFDHVATFPFRGVSGNIVQDVVNVGPDGPFVASAIGYGFEADRPSALVAPPPGVSVVKDLPLSAVRTEALLTGFRVHPRVTAVAGSRIGDLSIAALPADGILQGLRTRHPSFLFAMVDSATGRELQDQPTLAMASLGNGAGRRPFRALHEPLRLSARSTVRLQVIEQSKGVTGTLFVVLFGYKIVAQGRAAGRPTASAAPVRTIPFDYVANLELLGRPGRIVEDEIVASADGDFAASSVGYGLVSALDGIPVTPPDGNDNVDLGSLRLEALPVDVCQAGVRIRPSMARLAFSGASLTTSLPRRLLNELFEPAGGPDDLSFRYSFFESGSGRDLQSQPVHSVAGLGNARGDRPFKVLARPLRLSRGATLRVTVEEGFGVGRLQIVFHGHKVLGSARAGDRP